MRKEFFIISSTNGLLFLPEISGRGYTYTEPVGFGTNHCPRLFKREQDAKTALTWWLKGPASRAPSGHQSDLFGDLYSEDYWLVQCTGTEEERQARAAFNLIVRPIVMTLMTP